MYYSTEQCADFFDRQGIRYSVKEAADDNKRDIIRLSYAAENTDIIVHMFFSDDNEDVAIRVFGLVKVQEAKIPKMLDVINEQNRCFRFAKFCLNMDDHTIQVEIDAAFRSHNIGEICDELVSRIVSISQDAYAEFMKAMWS